MNNILKKIRVLLTDYGWALFIITFLLHESVVLLINYGIVNIPVTASDHLMYLNSSGEIYNLLNTGLYTWGAVFYQHWYPLLLGISYFPFGGPSVLIGTTINALLIAFSSILFFKITSSLNTSINKKYLFWITLVIMNGYASLMYNSSLLLKETWIVFLILSILYLAIKMYQNEKFNWWQFILILFLCLALRNLRFFVGFAMIVGFLVGWFFESKMFLRRRILYGIMMFILFSFTTSVLTGPGIGESKSFIEYINPGFIYNLRRQYFSDGATTTNINVVEQNNNLDETVSSTSQYKFSINGIIKSSSIIILGPFPWQLPIKKYIIAFPDLIMLYSILFFGLIGILKTKLKSSILYLIPIVIIFAGLIVGVDNLGALLRYRIPVVIILSVFIPAGLAFVFKSKNYGQTK
jgi:hypothetical protein